MQKDGTTGIESRSLSESFKTMDDREDTSSTMTFLGLALSGFGIYLSKIFLAVIMKLSFCEGAKVLVTRRKFKFHYALRLGNWTKRS